jgi:hypothetical protein
MYGPVPACETGLHKFFFTQVDETHLFLFGKKATVHNRLKLKRKERNETFHRKLIDLLIFCVNYSTLRRKLIDLLIFCVNYSTFRRNLIDFLCK